MYAMIRNLFAISEQQVCHNRLLDSIVDPRLKSGFCDILGLLSSKQSMNTV